MLAARLAGFTPIAMVPGVFPELRVTVGRSHVPPSLVVHVTLTAVPVGLLNTPMFCGAGRFESPCTQAKLNCCGVTESRVPGCVTASVKLPCWAKGGTELSVTVMVNGNEPVPVGVPLKTPPVLKLMLPGSAPELDHWY